MVLHLVYSSVPLPSLIWITIKTIIEHITNQTKRDAAYDATKELVYAIGELEWVISFIEIDFFMVTNA